MRLYLICDNEDIAVGMRLAGIQSVRAEASEVGALLEELAAQEDIGIILINESLAAGCREELAEFCRNHTMPLVAHVPDKNAEGAGDALAEYVRDAIGIKI